MTHRSVKTYFGFDNRDVKKSLIRFLNDSGFVKNRFSHFAYYPDSKRVGTERISSVSNSVILQKAKDSDLTELYIIPSKSALDESECRLLIIRFKRFYYVQVAQERMLRLEKEMETLSKRQRRFRSRSGVKNPVEKDKTQIQETENRLEAVIQEIDLWKKKLMNIQ